MSLDQVLSAANAIQKGVPGPLVIHLGDSGEHFFSPEATSAIMEAYQVAERELVDDKSYGHIPCHVHALFEECSTLIAQINTVFTLIKSLEVEKVTYLEKRIQIDAELEWLTSTELADLSAKKSTALMNMSQAYDGQINKISEIIDLYKNNKFLSLQYIQDRALIEERIAEIGSMGSGSWEIISEPVYVEPIRRIVNPPRSNDGREGRYFYFYAAARKWTVEQDLEFERAKRDELVADLEVRKQQTTQDLRANTFAEHNLNEELKERIFRVNALREAGARLASAVNLPGFSFDKRAAAAIVEFCVYVTLLTKRSYLLASALAAREGIMFEPLDGSKILEGEEVENCLARFRVHLSQLSVALQGRSMSSVESVLQVDLKMAQDECTFVLPRLGSFSRLKTLLIADQDNAGREVALSVESDVDYADPTGHSDGAAIALDLRSFVARADGANWRDATLDGAAMESISLPCVINLRVTGYQTTPAGSKPKMFARIIHRQ